MIKFLTQNSKTGHSDTKLFRYKLLRYKLKQWNCAKILFASSNVYVQNKKLTFLVKIIRSSSQGRETTHTLTEWTCIETTLFSNFVSKGCQPVTLNLLYFASKCPFLELCGILMPKKCQRNTVKTVFLF